MLILAGCSYSPRQWDEQYRNAYGYIGQLDDWERCEIMSGYGNLFGYGGPCHR